LRDQDDLSLSSAMFNVEVAFCIDQLNSSGNRGVGRHRDCDVVVEGCLVV
jgi:hypothetical protein